MLDGRGGETTQTFTVSVIPDTGNHAPRIVSTPVTDVGTGKLYHYAAAATDPDGDALTFDLPLRPEGMTIDPSSGAIDWRARVDQVGEHHVVLRVRDGRGGE